MSITTQGSFEHLFGTTKIKMEVSIAAALLLLVIQAHAGVYRFGSHKLEMKMEVNTNAGRVEAEYLANITTPDSRLTKRATQRSGHSTTTHSCGNVRGVPQNLRSPTEMRPDGLTNFYQKYTETYGIPIVGSSRVPDDALKRACYTVRFMLADRHDVRESFYKQSGRVGVMAASEQTLDIPEHSNLDPYMNQRARGLGATVALPLTTGAEENILCESHDRYPHEDILLHEFAHAVDLVGAHLVIPNWQQKRQQAYDHAMANNLWHDTYSATNPEEYWAEGVQSFFNVNSHDSPTDGSHVDTQDQLRSYDPQLFNLISEVFPCNNRYLKRCHSNRNLEESTHMSMDCAASSGGSTHSGGSTSGGTPSQHCADSNNNCASWAHNGECERNPGYMLENCKHSCNNCGGYSGGTSSVGSGTQHCTDSNNNCASWAHNGECERNPGYMLVSCKHSCNNCDGHLNNLIGK